MLNPLCEARQLRLTFTKNNEQNVPITIRKFACMFPWVWSRRCVKKFRLLSLVVQLPHDLRSIGLSLISDYLATLFSTPLSQRLLVTEQWLFHRMITKDSTKITLEMVPFLILFQGDNDAIKMYKTIQIFMNWRHHAPVYWFTQI